MYLLDSRVPENTESDQFITAQLYDSGRRRGVSAENLRVAQELVLGVGGVRLLREVGVPATVFHMNEGHAAFLGLERVRELMRGAGLSFEAALEAVASSGKPLGELFHQLELETNISHAYDRIDQHLEQPMTTSDLQKRLEGITELAGQRVENVSDRDGIKLTLEGNAWVLFRASGTEPVLRLYCEAPDMVFVRQSLSAAQALFTNRSANKA